MSNDNMSTVGIDELRQYGFLGGAGRNVVLGLDEVARVIRDVGAELAKRCKWGGKPPCKVRTRAADTGLAALDTPLLFSNQSLELNGTRMKMLIQTFLGTVRTSSRTPTKTSATTFAQDVTFASDQELAWLLRWALSRMTRVREPTREICHGCMDWEMYEEWRGRERGEQTHNKGTANSVASKYPLDAFPNLASILPADVYHYIIQPLFALMSRFAAHSHNSGLTPHALASFFAPLIFDVPTSVPCLQAHTAFVRAASATEHMFLAFIRSSGGRDNLGLTDLPFRLQEWVNGYPSMIASDIDLSRGRPRRAARVVKCEVATRSVRAYSRDLIVNAETWVDDMPGWPAWDRVTLKQRRGEASRPKFSSSWRRKMAVKEQLPLPTSRGLDEKIVYGAPAKQSGSGKPEEEGEVGKYASLAGKHWSAFEECGFDSAPRQSTVTSSRSKEEGEHVDINKRLQFDLNESAKQSVTERRQTMDWGQFADGGFTRTEPFLTASLTFSAPVQTSITEWPKERDELRRRLEKTQKEATPFNHDTTPRTGPAASYEGADASGRVYIEEAFIDCWADFMMGTGWMDRAELTFKRSSWAIIEYKARPGRPDEQDAAHPSVDPRTSELCFLFEEYVPLDYQMAIADPKRKKSLHKLFSTKKKNKALPPQPFTPRDDFDKMLSRTTAKKISLPRSDQSVSSSLWQSLGDAQNKPKTGTASLPSSPSMLGSSSSRTPKQPTAMSKSATASPLGPPLSERVADKHGKLGNGKPSFLKSIRRVKSGTDQREKAKKQREVSMDFEIQSASGLSSGNSSPQDGGEEKWMDILIANGARKMDANQKGLEVVASPPQKKNNLPVPPKMTDRGATPPASRSESDDVTPTNTRFGSLNNLEDKSGPAAGTGLGLQPPVQLGLLSSSERDFPGDRFELDDGTGTEPDFEHNAVDSSNSYSQSYSSQAASSSVYDGSSQHTAGSAATTGESVQPSDSISMRRRAAPSPPGSPRDVHTPQPPLRDSTASAYDGIVHAPQPRNLGERDAIFSIVDHYRDSRDSRDSRDAATTTPHGEDFRDSRATDFTEVSDGDAYGGMERDSYIERTYASERTNSAYNIEDDLHPPPIFDLTPGREPSPARYKHGEPLHFGK